MSPYLSVPFGYISKDDTLNSVVFFVHRELLPIKVKIPKGCKNYYGCNVSALGIPFKDLEPILQYLFDAHMRLNNLHKGE